MTLTITVDDHINILVGTKHLSLSKEQPSCQVQEGLARLQSYSNNKLHTRATKWPTCDRNQKSVSKH